MKFFIQPSNASHEWVMLQAGGEVKVIGMLQGNHATSMYNTEKECSSTYSAYNWVIEEYIKNFKKNV